MKLSRRDILWRGGVLGCSLAASPMVTPISLAAAPGENRLVVIILRGGMDGLDVVQPYGDPNYSALRKELQGGPEQGAHDMDGFFALHPALSELLPMWRKGELGFAHAVSTPYRDKRSHFDGQDLLEAGTPNLTGARDGWLNRLLQFMPNVSSETAYAIGRSNLRILQGNAPVANWSPETDLPISAQAKNLLELVMEGDPMLHAALAEAQMLAQENTQRGNRRGHKAVAAFAAQKLRGQSRIAAFSLNGWDTHSAQKRSIARSLKSLSETIATLKSDLGTVWDKTAVVAVTEFGRTARENGTGGTNHGTGGLMILAGGSVRGGRVWGDWPGLASSELYAGRDLMPTRDVRAHTAWLMHGLFGIEKGALESAVFPGLELGGDPGILL